MRKVRVALAPGDGSAPEMMKQAVWVTEEAAKLDGVELEYTITPMGWSALKEYGDTLPASSLKIVKELGLLFFGSVGDPELDKTLGVKYPKMKPEGHCLLTLRKEMGLLVNMRPMLYMKAFAHLGGVREDRIPEEGVRQDWARFLAEDDYFGNRDLSGELSEEARNRLGIKLKDDVTGEEAMVTDLAYYSADKLRKYFRALFVYAQSQGLPVISVDKSNVMPRYVYWREIGRQVRKEFPEVAYSEMLVDTACASLFHPTRLQGVIACGNQHGDILSDGAAEAVGGMGLMYSSAVNPDTGEAMFESGAGTAPTLANLDKANPIGRILTGKMLLEHIGAVKGAAAIEMAVKRALTEGYRTGDLFTKGKDDPGKLLGTSAMGEKVMSLLAP